VDNRQGIFDYPRLFEFLNRHSPKTVVVDVDGKGQTVPLNHAYLFRSEGGNIGLDSFIANISELFRREIARGELAAMLIHDIRSPLNSMNAYIELLLNRTFGPLNEGQQNFLEKAINLGDQTLEMLEDIHDIYRTEQHIFSLDREPFAAHKVVDDALLNIWPIADRKNIKIRKKVSRWLPKVYGDTFQIQRVLVNLLENAIKYCPENAELTVEVHKQSRQVARFLVRDNGGGIPENALKEIFRKSFRIKSDAQHQKGFGLGLYICKLIVKTHGGTIHAENNDQGGVTMIFTLPFHSN